MWSLRKNSWENERFETVEYSLIIRGDLDFGYINNTLCFKSPKMIKKGDIISKVVGESQEDVYIYSKKYENIEKMNENLDDFLTEILTVKNEICNLYQNNDISLRIYTQSSQSQISFLFTKENLLKLKELNIPVDFSILSWGEI